MTPFINIFEKQLANLRQRQEVLAILIFSLVSCFIWVGVDLVSSQKQTAITAELQKLALPLNPTIDQQVIDELQQKRNYELAELESFPIYRIVTAKEREQRIRQEASTANSSQPASNLGTLSSSFLEPETTTEPDAATAAAETTSTDLGETPEEPEESSNLLPESSPSVSGDNP